MTTQGNKKLTIEPRPKSAGIPRTAKKHMQAAQNAFFRSCLSLPASKFSSQQQKKRKKNRKGKETIRKEGKEKWKEKGKGKGEKGNAICTK